MTEVRLITFRSAIFGEISQDFVLHAVGKKGILFFVAQVFKRQNGDALFRSSGGAVPRRAAGDRGRRSCDSRPVRNAATTSSRPQQVRPRL